VEAYVFNLPGVGIDELLKMQEENRAALKRLRDDLRNLQLQMAELAASVENTREELQMSSEAAEEFTATCLDQKSTSSSTSMQRVSS
jgi:chromosome segregation ATPase